MLFTLVIYTLCNHLLKGIEMAETIQERLHRLANNGHKATEKPKREFKMPVDTIEPPKGKGTLMKLLDDVDVKQIGRVR